MASSMCKGDCVRRKKAGVAPVRQDDGENFAGGEGGVEVVRSRSRRASPMEEEEMDRFKI
jgi:hypothetical protein